MIQKLIVLYDADCGFCSGTAAFLAHLDRGRRLRLLPLTAAASHLADAPAVDQLLARMHVRRDDGTWFHGGAGWMEIASAVPALRPLAWVARRPLIRRAVEPTYALVARNRDRLRRRGANACAVPGRTT